MAVLQKEAELQDIVQLVGADALPEEERLTLETGRLIREVFLQQNAYHPVDSYCPIKVQALLLKVILSFSDAALAALKRGVALGEIMQVPSISALTRARFEKERESIIQGLSGAIPKEIDALKQTAQAGTTASGGD